MIWKLTPLAAAILLAAHPAPVLADQNSYLCIVDYAAGMAFNKQTEQWSDARFKPGDKYIVRSLRAAERGRYDLMSDTKTPPEVGVFAFGSELAISACRWDFAISPPDLICEYAGAYAIVNVPGLRFQVMHIGQYVRPPPKKVTPLTPSIEVGRCSPL